MLFEGPGDQHGPRRCPGEPRTRVVKTIGQYFLTFIGGNLTFLIHYGIFRERNLPNLISGNENGGMKMEDVEFVCSACEKGYEGETENVMTECRLCHRIHCKDCVDEFGRCIECADKES